MTDSPPFSLPPSLSQYLCGRRFPLSALTVDRMMVSHYCVPTVPLSQGRSKVSHELQLSRQEKIILRLTLSALFVACLAGLLFLVNVVASLEGFPASRDECRSRGILGFDKSPSASSSTSWAYYSPYYPAGKFKGPTREGCVVSQVNIVSSIFLLRSILSMIPLLCITDAVVSHSSNATEPDTQLSE